MAKEPYRVDYHIVLKIYFEPGHGMSGSDFTSLWSSIEMYGKYRASAGFWGPNGADLTKCRTDIGSLEFVDPLRLKYGDAPIYGGGTYAKRNAETGSPLDCDFYYGHTHGSGRCFGYDMLPALLYTISGQWLERVGVNRVVENMKEHFEVADRYTPRYGLIDVSPAQDCYGGTAYESFFFGNCLLHRWVEQEKWLYACIKRRDQARGIYWGNYFGPAILERLGGREAFVKRFRAQATRGLTPERAANPDHNIWEFDNGLFVSVCRNPLGCKPGPPLNTSAAVNARWLTQDLGKRGVLNPWLEDD